jgi:hypothetical protein
MTRESATGGRGGSNRGGRGWVVNPTVEWGAGYSPWVRQFVSRLAAAPGEELWVFGLPRAAEFAAALAADPGLAGFRWAASGDALIGECRRAAEGGGA